ncbi:hypothetical protein GmHk_01G002860 [Glycine max]|nr:hypothetical protein GmHk_01G002860 [Glycine max]
MSFYDTSKKLVLFLKVLFEFSDAKDVDRKNFLYIEYLLGRGNKQLDQLRNPGTAGLSSLQLHFFKINYSDPSTKG